MVSQIGRINSLITFNDRIMDQMITSILQNLNSDKFDETKPDLGKLMGNLMAFNKDRNHTSRENTIDLLYDYLKSNFLKHKTLRSTYRERVFKNNSEILELTHIIKGSLEDRNDSNHYKDKLEKAFPIMQELLLLSLDMLNGHLAVANNLNMRVAGIGDQMADSNMVQILAKTIREVTEFDSAVYGMMIMDANFASALIAKSLQCSNRKLFETVNVASRQSIEAANSYFYLQLAKEGSETLPEAIDDFLKKFQQFMQVVLIDNLNLYLLAQEDDVMSKGITNLDDPFESTMKANSKRVNECIDLAVDRINLYIEEVANGKYSNTITFNVFNRTYSEVMLKLGPKLSSFEDYK